jgi:hypothetical protein
MFIQPSHVGASDPCCCCCCVPPSPPCLLAPPTPIAVEEEGDPNSTEVDGLSFLVEDAEEGGDDEELDPAAIEIVDDIPAEVTTQSLSIPPLHQLLRLHSMCHLRVDHTQCRTCTVQHSAAHCASTHLASTAMAPNAQRQLQGQVQSMHAVPSVRGRSAVSLHVSRCTHAQYRN